MEWKAGPHLPSVVHAIYKNKSVVSAYSCCLYNFFPPTAIALDFKNVVVPWSLEILGKPEHGRGSRVAEELYALPLSLHMAPLATLNKHKL